MEIPYTVTARPDTGMWNGKLGIWLFLASEVMLFGGFFSAYIFLRLGAGDAWPVHYAETHLKVWPGLLNTVVLIFSSMAMVIAWMKLKERKVKEFRVWLGAVLACAAAFMVIKLGIEYAPKFASGYYPKTSPFYSIYYTMTGLHGLHVLGGAIVLLYHGLCTYKWFPGYQVYRANPEQLANRVECGGLFWHLVDLIWIFLFPLFYLL